MASATTPATFARRGAPRRPPGPAGPAGAPVGAPVHAPVGPPVALAQPPPWCLDGDLPGSWDARPAPGSAPATASRARISGDYNDNNVPDCDEQPYQHQEGDPVEYTVEDMRQIRAACP